MPSSRIERLRVSYVTVRRILMYLAQVKSTGKRRYAAHYAEARLRGVPAWEAESCGPIGGAQPTGDEATGVRKNIEGILQRQP